MTAVQTDKMWAPLVEALVEALENHEITGEWFCFSEDVVEILCRLYCH